MRRLLATAAAAAVLLTACGAPDQPAAEPSATDPATPQESSPTEPSSAVPPTTAPTTAATAVVTTIPDDIPLGIDLWDARGDGGEFHAEPYHPGPSERGTRLDICGQRVWPVMDGGGRAAVDELTAWATGPEYADTRDLVTLQTSDAAVAAIEAFRLVLRGCPEDGHIVWSVLDGDTGQDSVTFSGSYTDGLGLNTIQVTRVGNAVLYTETYGEGAIDDGPFVARHRTDLTKQITASLCVFTSAGCGADPSSAPAGAIPDGFPLAAGWPRHHDSDQPGLTGPNRTLPALELAPCDVPAADPAFTDRLRAEWSDIVDFRSRQLTTYRNDAAATSALRAIVEAYRSCPGHEINDEFTSHFALDETTYGDESWSVAATETQAEGYPTTYLEVLHLVRVGRALLVDTDHGEGGGAPPGMLEDFVAGPIADAAALIDAMCVFRESGCSPAGDQREVVDQRGFGPVQLGTDRADLVDLGARFDEGGNAGCESFVVRVDKLRVAGQIDAQDGVTVLYLDDWGETPEHIGQGSTQEDVRAAYPELTPPTLTDPTTIVPLDGAMYVLRSDQFAQPHRVYAAALMAQNQDCTIL